MKSSSISNSNAMLLGLRKWAATVLIVVVFASVVYYGWDGWEYYQPGSDHRETCWAERQSDYWAYIRWLKTARERYPVLLLGDSVIWGQEVDNDETISHYINRFLGEDLVANAGNDGLHMAGINGIVTHYGDNFDGANVIVQFSPLWIGNLTRDLRGERKSRPHHPQLIPQLDPRINYYNDLNTRIGYLSEYVFPIFPFVRHIMVNYFNNKSISKWVMDNPYSNPFAAINFVATPVMAKSQGASIDWITKKMKMSSDPFIDIDDSIQFECFMHALETLRTDRNANVFILLGPFNEYHLLPDSHDGFDRVLDQAKARFAEMGIPFYDTREAGIPSDTFADSCHLLREGHVTLARGLTGSVAFREWIDALR